MIGGALLVAFLIRTFLLAAFYIPSASMVPTLEEGDRVLVNKLSYKLHDVNRGDIVVFERPPGEPDNGIKDLIKRVIALPGETVEGRDGQVVVNGRYLEEPYLDEGPSPTEFPPETVEEGKVWVMGDNREVSVDSRYFHAIPMTASSAAPSSPSGPSATSASSDGDDAGRAVDRDDGSIGDGVGRSRGTDDCWDAELAGDDRAWLSWAPTSTTMPAAARNRGVQAGSVMGATRMSPGSKRPARQGQ